MKQYRIEITELAERDLENADDYIAYELKNPSAAKNTVKGLIHYRIFLKGSKKKMQRNEGSDCIANEFTG